MSAERLREAAALMRSRAQLARAGIWQTEASALAPDATLVVAQWRDDLRRVATCSGSLPEGNIANAEHIASWHPAVALAAADWLEFAAEGREALNLIASHGGRPLDSEGSVLFCDMERRALAVADAYLGGAS